ncbi:DUF4136 domain-containing protein [candidate division KSB1 bacterium]|nr:DUF4136 domain-containing protein [candidate division KSB1 bacterium]
MRFTRLLLSLLLVATMNCSRMRVKQEYNEGFDFSRMKTFTWLEQPEKPFEYLTNPIANWQQIDKQIKEAVNRELERRGYIRTFEGPDFSITYHLRVQDKIYSHDQSYRTDYRTDKSVRLSYREGTLVLDFVDAETSELLWRGSASRTVSQAEPDPEDTQEKITTAVQRMLESFPPAK